MKLFQLSKPLDLNTKIGSNSSDGTMPTSGKGESTNPYNLNPSLLPNTVMSQKASNNSQDLCGIKKTKVDL